MNVFTEIKERISMVEICSMLGLTPNRAGFIPCPHHFERTPSCKIYPTSFYCYSCSRGGDAIQLVADYRGVSQLEALREVDSFFSLGLMGRENKPAPRKNRKPREVSLDQCNTVYRNATLDMLAECCRVASKVNASDWEELQVIHQELLESSITEVADFKVKFGKGVKEYVNKYIVG